MSAWPSTLPQKFQDQSYSETPQSAVVRSTVDAGPAKVRQRFTAISTYIAGSMIMSEAQLSTFKSFFSTTCAGGSLSFTFPDPHGGSDLTCRFMDVAKPAPQAPGYWTQSISIEALP